MSKYQVLARKYRPKKLSELIGQDALVQTISNAISQNRLPHAFVLTGIRGVGKTSTARIIARSLLCTGVDDKNELPTTEPCGVCANCQSISNDNHIDVIEVDAASRTGVDDIREIIDQVSYAPVMGRYKIYIIDEVHMLSKSAFNALLKTLEEPPSHVKFIFATTEVRKIPVTILSRCMRFDLPRVKGETLINHFSRVVEAENAKVDIDAIRVIADASEGSVRDGLSLLDQAIVTNNGEEVTAKKVRQMLGLSDKDNIFSLVENLLEGNFEASLELSQKIYDEGADANVIIKDMLEVTHKLMMYKASPALLNPKLISEVEITKAKQILQKNSLPKLGRMWQVINKAIEESNYCPSPLMALEMSVVRCCYTAKLPTPEEIISGKASINFATKEEIITPTEAVQEQEEENLFAQKKSLLNS
ncbi:MAG: DNA polymerase III subunit gamma/tau [Rickettsiales bacterium]|nr:DNA polymerase III subunit gamma/tau [Rickettsiales bacterium]